MEIDTTRMVKDIVLAEPASAKVFEQMGIDYCCGGNKPLADAWKWDRKRSGGDITPLVAITLAHWGIVANAQRAPEVFDLNEIVTKMRGEMTEQPITDVTNAAEIAISVTPPTPEPPKPGGVKFIPLSQL